MTESGEFAMWLAIGAGQVAFWTVLSPVFKALADRIRRKGMPAGDRLEELQDRLAALEQRSPITGEVEAQMARLAELEERVDFAERMLTRQRSAALPGGGNG